MAQHDDMAVRGPGCFGRTADTHHNSRRTREAQQVARLRQQARVQQQAQQLGVPRRPQVRRAVRLRGGDVAHQQSQYAQRRLVAARLPCSTVSRLPRYAEPRHAGQC